MRYTMGAPQWTILVFAIAGAGIMLLSIFLFINGQIFFRTAISADGSVIDLVRRESGADKGRYSYYPKITFIANDGKEYEFISNVGSNPSFYSINQNVKVLYNPKNITDARIDNFFDFWFWPLFLFIFGSLFCFIGTLPIRKAIRRRWLLKNGRLIEATVQNNLNPYIITAQWIDDLSSSAYIFRSDRLRFNPGDYIKSGDKIKVFIDPKNPKKYFIDTSFLPTIKN